MAARRLDIRLILIAGWLAIAAQAMAAAQAGWHHHESVEHSQHQTCAVCFAVSAIGVVLIVVARRRAGAAS